MENLSCDICMDLIPLVRDGVASDDSRRAVQAHAEGCENCRRALSQTAASPPMNDGRVLAAIRRRLFGGAIALMLLGAFVGLGLSESAGMFYNTLILPAVGAVGYFALRRRAGLVPLGLFVLVYLWHLVKYLLPGGVRESFSNLFVAPLYWSVLYSGLCALGAAIAALLNYAFRKEKPHEKGN